MKRYIPFVIGAGALILLVWYHWPKRSLRRDEVNEVLEGFKQ